MSNRIAIVGMEVLLGPDEGLDAFDRTVFDGIRHSMQGKPEDEKRVRAGTKSECKEGYLRLLDRSVSPNAFTLTQTVIQGVLRGSPSTPSEQEPRDGPLILVTGADLSSLARDSTRVVRADSVWLGLETAQGLLAEGEAPWVLLAAVHSTEGGTGSVGSSLSLGQGAAAVLLKRLDQAEEDGDLIFAAIDAIARETSQGAEPSNPSMDGVEAAAKKALGRAGVSRDEIGCLESCAWDLESGDPREIVGLVRAYGSSGAGLTCALGSARTNTGDCGPVSGLASVIKAALCLYHRYIPGTPGWTAPRNEASWADSPFYVPTDSRPWFLAPGACNRAAAVSGLEDGAAVHLILSEDVRVRSRPNRYLALVSPYCFPLAGEDPADLVEQLEALQRHIETSPALIERARQNLAAFRDRPDAAYALMIVGHSREELSREIGFMRKGLPQAFEKGTELKTPKGSYFSANPLGEKGKVAFVYPGVGSAYVGLGQSLFHLFPELYEDFSRVTPDMGAVLRDEELYPRTLERLTEDEIWKRELGLRRDILSIGESGTGFFVLFTMTLQNVFKVTPQCALGYSLGEPGMVASLGVWDEPGRLTGRFRRSPTFQERLSGELTAVRDSWSLPEDGPDRRKKLWDTFTLQATPSVVRRAIAEEERVYMTIINAPDEVVIAGDPERCRRVIKKIGCKHYVLGLDLAIHCDPTRTEYDRIVDLYTLPVRKDTEIKFYSSSCYKPIPLRSKAVAHSIAKAYSEPVDFPRLVHQVYEDGARLFIELGSRKFCSNLIDRILHGKDHLTMAINVKGTKDQASLVRILAQLVSHRVPVDLSPLF
jgi:PfaB family protein